MKYRYLKITGETIWGTNDLTREDLARLKGHSYDCILDLQKWKFFNADENSWEDIEGEK